MMLHVLVEGPSEKVLLDGLLPRLIPKHRFKVYPHQGKGRLTQDPNKRVDIKQRGLLDQLPATLRVFGRTMDASTDRVVVLVDADDDDCVELLERLKGMLATMQPAPLCLFRIAIEEVESWYLGDWAAIKKSFPNADRKAMSRYRPDERVGAWELFQAVVKDSSARKLLWADKVSGELSIALTGRAVNKSPSFQKFCQGVLRHVGEATSERQGSQKPPLKAKRRKPVRRKRQARRVST